MSTTDRITQALTTVMTPVFEAVARANIARLEGRPYVEAAAVVRRGEAIVVVARVHDRKVAQRLDRMTSNRFVLFDAMGRLISERRYVGLSDLAYFFHAEGWGDATVEPADSDKPTTARRLAAAVARLGNP